MSRQSQSQPHPHPSPSRRLRTATALITAFNNLSVADIMRLFHPSCTHAIHPLSLALPAEDNGAYEKRLRAVLPAFEGFRLVLDDVVEQEEESGEGGKGKRGKMSLWLRAEGVMKGKGREIIRVGLGDGNGGERGSGEGEGDGKETGPVVYRNEYVWGLEFEGEGDGDGDGDGRGRGREREGGEGTEDVLRIVRMKEFVDVGVFRDFRGRLRESILVGMGEQIKEWKGQDVGEGKK